MTKMFAPHELYMPEISTLIITCLLSGMKLIITINLLLFILFARATAVFAQHTDTTGTAYTFTLSSAVNGVFHQSLILKKDGRFLYRLNNCLYEAYSAGRWRYK